jgi:hypothetical protein
VVPAKLQVHALAAAGGQRASAARAAQPSRTGLPGATADATLATVFRVEVEIHTAVVALLGAAATVDRALTLRAEKPVVAGVVTFTAVVWVEGGQRADAIAKLGVVRAAPEGLARRASVAAARSASAT